MTVRRAEGPYTTAPAADGDVGVVAHIDGEPVVIGALFAHGVTPDGEVVNLAAVDHADRFTLSANQCMGVSDEDLRGGLIAAAIEAAGGGA